jgi:hypothetical protein
MSNDVVRFRAKPNALLYAVEASRLFFILMLVVALLLMLVAHLATGIPVGGFMLGIVAAVYGAMSVIAFVAVVCFARCMEFIVTNKRVIVRASLMGRTQDNISIPIESISSIEVQPYNACYGSVYFEWGSALPLENLPHDGSRSQISNYSCPAFNSAADRSRRVGNLVVRSRPMWRSITSTAPPLSGFYGFRHFNSFAELVAELQAGA